MGDSAAIAFRNHHPLTLALQGASPSRAWSGEEHEREEESDG